MPGSAGSRVDLPGRSGFQNYALKCREPVTYIDVPLLCSETLFTWLEIKYI
jgi:hypothetical protein